MYFQVDPYEIISILLESLLYGIFLVLFLLSTVLLLQRRRYLLEDKPRGRSRLRSLTIYLVTGVLMFFTITAKWTFYWPEVLPIDESAPLPRVPRLGRTAYRFKEACIQATILLGDFIIIYRLWILTNRRKLRIIPPVIGLFAFLTCAIALSGPFNDTDKMPIPLRGGKIRLTRWDIGATAVTLSITIYSTIMISWIILGAQSRAGTRLSGHGVKKALVVLVESAAISATWNLLFFITGLGFKSQIALAFLDCLPAVYGISAMLINVRVGLGFARGAEGGVGPGQGERGWNGVRDDREYHSTLVFTTQISSGVPELELDTRSSRVSSVTVAGTTA